MTTLTQSELDDLRQKAEAVGGAWSYVPAHIAEGPSQVRHREGWLVCEVPSDEIADFIARSSIAIPALLDRIAQLTADESDSLWFWKIVDTYDFSPMPRDRRAAIDLICSDLECAEARIAELEAQPSAPSFRRWRVFSSTINRKYYGIEFEDASNDEDAIALDLPEHRARALVESHNSAAKPSAQFVAGMREAAKIAESQVFTASAFNAGGKCATAILAEAALKGEGE